MMPFGLGPDIPTSFVSTLGHLGVNRVETRVDSDHVLNHVDFRLSPMTLGFEMWVLIPCTFGCRVW